MFAKADDGKPRKSDVPVHAVMNNSKTAIVAIGDCTIVTVYRVTGMCGGVIGDVSTQEEATGDACDGTEGGVIINVETVAVDDCP